MTVDNVTMSKDHLSMVLAAQLIILHLSNDMFAVRRRVGNTNKLGAMFGILSAIGAPVPSPGSPMFFVRLATNAVRSFISGE